LDHAGAGRLQRHAPHTRVRADARRARRRRHRLRLGRVARRGRRRRLLRLRRQAARPRPPLHAPPKTSPAARLSLKLPTAYSYSVGAVPVPPVLPKLPPAPACVEVAPEMSPVSRTPVSPPLSGMSPSAMPPGPALSVPPVI